MRKREKPLTCLYGPTGRRTTRRRSKRLRTTDTTTLLPSAFRTERERREAETAVPIFSPPDSGDWAAPLPPAHAKTACDAALVEWRAGEKGEEKEGREIIVSSQCYRKPLSFYISPIGEKVFGYAMG